MFDIISINEEMLFTTTRIETRAQGQLLSAGTGFFFKIDVDAERAILVVVTNKHVVKGADFGTFHLHESEGNGEKPAGRSLTVNVKNFDHAWIPHPNEEVDLCAMPLRFIRDIAQAKGKTLFIRYIEERHCWSDEQLEGLQAVEEVMMIGYPNGLWDAKHNLPLVRKGITATHPSIDFNGDSKTVVDMACWPGSSGSPVMIVNESHYHQKGGGLRFGKSRVILLGVLSGGPVHTAIGEVVVRPIPMQVQLATLTEIPLNLGFVIKAKELEGLKAAVLAADAQLRSAV